MSEGVFYVFFENMRALFSGGAFIHKLRSIIVFFFALSFYARPDNMLARDCRVCYNKNRLYRYSALIFMIEKDCYTV